MRWRVQRVTDRSGTRIEVYSKNSGSPLPALSMKEGEARDLCCELTFALSPEPFVQPLPTEEESIAACFGERSGP